MAAYATRKIVSSVQSACGNACPELGRGPAGRDNDRVVSVCIAPRPMLKALSWLARTGQIESLVSLLSNPLAKAFASPQQPQERKEALYLCPWEHL